MKKSELYHCMQEMLISEDCCLDDDVKLEALREMMRQEDLAKFSEEQEANNA